MLLEFFVFVLATVIPASARIDANFVSALLSLVASPGSPLSVPDRVLSIDKLRLYCLQREGCAG